MGYCSLDGYSNRTTCETAGGTWTDSPPSYEYGYYIKGNKFAIVERDTQFDNDVNSKDYGPGSRRTQWKSPAQSVTDGIELQYVYSPEYRINDLTSTGDESITSYRAQNGLLRLDGTGFPTSGVTHIVITGSDRFSGLHTVDDLTSSSRMILKTKYNGAVVTESSTLWDDVTALTDEESEIDLPSYLNSALVYFVKAKLAEDQRDMDGREYFMREFKRILEKHNNTRIAGIRRVATGAHAIR